MPARFQFDLATLMTWMIVVSVMCAVAVQMPMGGGVILLGLPLLFAPILIAALRRAPRGLAFSLNSQAALTLFVVGHSVVMFALSALLMVEWKGGKGFHWYYYLLDGLAGVAWWPLFFWGAWMFVKVVHQERSTREMQLALIGVTGNFLIAVYYVYGCVMLNFAGKDDRLLLWAPFSAAVSYGLFAAALLRRMPTLPKDETRLRRKDVAALAGAWSGLTGLKVGIAMHYYESLPDTQPSGCFIVTAASRGHSRLVGSWYDARRGKRVNQQLLMMWRFEQWLALSLPRLHGWLRRHYNRWGPQVARRIRRRWQADATYLALKPVEWFAATVLNCFGHR